MQNEELIEAIVSGDEGRAADLTRELLEKGISAKEIMEELMIPAMGEVGDKFETKEYFVPEVLVSARAMNAALELVEPILAQSGQEPLGMVLLGTVKGDVHDIGKNIVALMLQGAGFQVVNLGADVDPQTFLAAVKDHKPDILGMSSLLTTAMHSMKSVIDLLAAEGLRTGVKIMIGGAAITSDFATRIGADAYGDDANTAVRIAKGWCN